MQSTLSYMASPVAAVLAACTRWRVLSCHQRNINLIADDPAVTGVAPVVSLQDPGVTVTPVSAVFAGSVDWPAAGVRAGQDVVVRDGRIRVGAWAIGMDGTVPIRCRLAPDPHYLSGSVRHGADAGAAVESRRQDSGSGAAAEERRQVTHGRGDLDCRRIAELKEQVAGRTLPMAASAHGGAACRRDASGLSVSGWQNRLDVRLREAAARLTGGLAEGWLDEFALRKLIGLGVGLTPAGDDFLVGLISWLTWRDDRSAAVVRMRDAIRSGAADTTPLSAALLTAAVEGDFALPLLRLYAAWNDPDDARFAEAARVVSGLGHTSGIDLLGGVLAGTQVREAGGRHTRAVTAKRNRRPTVISAGKGRLWLAN